MTGPADSAESTDVRYSRLLAAFEPAALWTDRDGRVLAVNRRFSELVALEPEDIVGTERPYPWWPNDQRGWFAAQVGHRLDSAAERTKFEGEHVDARGRRFPVTGSVSRLTAAEGLDGGLLWMLRDTTEVRSAVRSATEEVPDVAGDVDLEVALRRLFESNLIGIITGERDRILTANNAFLDMLGYTRSEFESGGIDWPSITPSEWLDVDAVAGEQMLRTGRSGPIEKEYLRRDGSRVRVRIAGAVVDFEPFRWVSFVEDITDLARQTHRLEAANQRLNELIGMAAHDLRSPNATIRWFSELLLDSLEGALGDSELMMLERIHRSSEKVSAQLNDLLSLSEVERGHLALHPQEHDLSDVVAETVELMEPIANDKGITIVCDLQDGLTVVVDGGKVEQVCVNLISNALKYSPPGSQVRVGTRTVGDEAILYVSDDGQGILEQEQAEIFRPFAKSSAQPTAGEASTGLGLAITKRIVEGHGGSIAVDSTVGEGSTFMVSLPRDGHMERT